MTAAPVPAEAAPAQCQGAAEGHGGSSRPPAFWDRQLGSDPDFTAKMEVATKAAESRTGASVSAPPEHQDAILLILVPPEEHSMESVLNPELNC